MVSIRMLDSKLCKTCGRPFTWRKKWQEVWDEVMYCSDQCRKNKPSAKDREIEKRILELLSSPLHRQGCNASSIAETFTKESNHSPSTRVMNAIRRLASQDKVIVMQRGSNRQETQNFKGDAHICINRSQSPNK